MFGKITALGKALDIVLRIPAMVVAFPLMCVAFMIGLICGAVREQWRRGLDS